MANVHSLPTELLNNARQLRRNITDCERLLWELLRGRRFNGIKFRRQHPVPPYVLDFFAPELRLAIELDGGHHSEQLNRDRARDQHLAALGIRTFRFWNSSVNDELEGVLEQLWIATTNKPGLH